MKLRIKFTKFGPVKFIGHLDVMRYFQKALRRADVDVAYSGGFSPHQIMSFAAPLGVGLESYGEYFDVEINSPISSQEFMDRVNAVSIPEIQVTDVRLLPEKAGNAMASVAAAGYTVRFREGRGFQALDWQQKFAEFMNQKEILISKKTKSGSAEVDLKPAIYDYSILLDDIVNKISDDLSDSRSMDTINRDSDCIYLLVNASSEGNIKPSLVMEAFAKYLGEELQENALMITREETYGYQIDGEGKGKRVPLAEFGEWMD